MSTTRKIRCTDCGEAVPYGRLSCPSCGTLLASVAGGVRHAPTPAVVASTPIDVRSTTADPDATSVAAPAVSPSLRPRPRKPTPPRPAAQRAAAQLTLVPTTVVRSVTAGAGAFIPATAGAAAGGGGGWAAHVNSGRSTAAVADPPEAQAVAAEPPDGAGFSLKRPSLGLGLDHARLDAGLEWAAALGGGLLAIAMLLPWSRSVIGSSGIGYFDSWGLAGPGHGFLLIGSLVVLVLAVLPTKVPTWISRGLSPLILGVLALGLTWPYTIGPLGSGIGVVVTLIAALVLIVTGIVGDWHTRHADDDPPV